MPKPPGFTKDAAEQITARAGGICERCADAPVQQWHHRRPRGMGGTKRASTQQAANGFAICEPCHRHIETQSRYDAISSGWLVHQYREPADVALLYRGRMALLDNEGGIEWVIP